MRATVVFLVEQSAVAGAVITYNSRHRPRLSVCVRAWPLAWSGHGRRRGCCQKITEGMATAHGTGTRMGTHTEWSTCTYVVDGIHVGEFICSHTRAAQKLNLSDMIRSEADIQPRPRSMTINDLVRRTVGVGPTTCQAC